MLRKLITMMIFSTITVVMPTTGAEAKICPAGQVSLGGTCYPLPGSVDMSTVITGLSPFNVGDQVTMIVKPGSIGDLKNGERTMPGLVKCLNSQDGENWGVRVSRTGQIGAAAELITFVDAQGKTLLPLSVEWTTAQLTANGNPCPKGHIPVGFIPDRFQLEIVTIPDGDGSPAQQLAIVCEEFTDIGLNKKTKSLEGSYTCDRCSGLGAACDACVVSNGVGKDGFETFRLSGTCAALEEE